MVKYCLPNHYNAHHNNYAVKIITKELSQSLILFKIWGRLKPPNPPLPTPLLNIHGTVSINMLIAKSMLHHFYDLHV